MESLRCAGLDTANLIILLVYRVLACACVRYGKADAYLRLSKLVGITLPSQHNGTLHGIYNPSLGGLQHRELRPLECKIVLSFEILFHRDVGDNLAGLSLAKVKFVLASILLGDSEDFEGFP